MLLGPYSANLMHKELDAICIILEENDEDAKPWKTNKSKQLRHTPNVFSYCSAELGKWKTSSSPLVAYDASQKAYFHFRFYSNS